MSKKSPKSRRKDEVNYKIKASPLLSAKCFICDERIQGKSVPLVMGQTHFSKATYPSKIGELVGDDFMVVVCMEDVLCGRCANLLNHLDKLETDLRVVRRTLTGYLASKYNINHKDLFAKFEKEGTRKKENTGQTTETEAVQSALKVYRCELCNFSTRDKNKVGVHAEECMNLRHACALCPKRFSSIENHAEHAVIVHKLTTSCQVCSALFVCEEDVVDHMKSHTAVQSQVKEQKSKLPGIEDKKELVEACLEELAKDQDSEPRLLPEDTTEIEFHTCTVCALTFLKASLFNEHMKMHENLKESACQNESSTTNFADVCRVDDDLEDLFEKLHAETNDSTKTEKPSANNQTVSNQDQAPQATDIVPLETVETNGDTNFVSSCTKDPLKPGNVKKKEQCCVCLNLFVSKHKLVSHLESHREGGDCRCSVCGQLVAGEALLKHCRQHSPEETNSIKCRFCSLTFKTARSWKSHEEKHTDVFVFACTQCDRRFLSEKELSAHKDRLHRTDPFCRHCGKKIDNPQALRRHEQRHNNPEKNFQCNECQRIFKTRTGLSHHTAVHTGQFKFCCDFCGRGFMSRVLLEEHRRKHTKEDRYICDVCGQKFSFQSTYWIHRKWHDNPFPYKCNFCGKFFRHTSLLAVHKRKHTGERPYKCPHCLLTFPVGNSLKRHLILHTGAYPYTCQDCNKGFTTRDKYSSHRAKVHGDYSLINRKSESKDLKMVVREIGESDETHKDAAAYTWEFVNGVNLEEVLGESADCATQESQSMVVDATGSRLVEIVMDDSYEAVATVTVAGAGVADSDSAIAEAWFN